MWHDDTYSGHAHVAIREPGGAFGTAADLGADISTLGAQLRTDNAGGALLLTDLPGTGAQPKRACTISPHRY